MKIFSEKLRLTLAALLACAALLPAAAGAADWKLSSSINYDTGKYGTTSRTDSFYVPFTLKRYFSSWDLSVTVPYLRQSSTGQVIWVGGQPTRGPGKHLAAGTAGQGGLGDIMLRGNYPLLLEEHNTFDLALAGKLKLPTADKDKGLGTGEADAGAGLELAKEVAAGWTLMADGYYTLIGQPAGEDFNNQLSLDAGFYRQLSEKTGLTVLYEARNAIVNGNAGPRSLSGTLSMGGADGAQYFCGLTLGLSDGSPDAGASLGLSKKF